MTSRLSLLLLPLLLVGVGCDAMQESAPVDVQFVVDDANPLAVTRITFDDGTGPVELDATTAWSHTFTTSADAPFEIRAEQIGGGAATVRIYVDGSLVVAARDAIVYERRRGRDTKANEIELRGPIEAKNATSVVVVGTTFIIDATTRLLDDDNNAIAFDAFQVGQFIEAEGHRLSDDTVQAKKLKFEDEGADDHGGRGNEPGDDHGGHGNEPGDDHGGHGNEPGDDHGGD